MRKFSVLKSLFWSFVLSVAIGVYAVESKIVSYIPMELWPEITKEHKINENAFQNDSPLRAIKLRLDRVKGTNLSYSEVREKVSDVDLVLYAAKNPQFIRDFFIPLGIAWLVLAPIFLIMGYLIADYYRNKN